MITHSNLLKIAAALGYTSIGTEGMCQGFSGMWTQAVCSDETDNFMERLELLGSYANFTEYLLEDISNAREKARTLGFEGLSNRDKILYELPAFFEGIALYLLPQLENHTEVFGKSLNQRDFIEISSYTLSKKLEAQGGISKAQVNIDQYNSTQLTAYLNSLGEKLKDRPDVSVLLYANLHSVAIRVVGPDAFQLIDTNHLRDSYAEMSSKELSRELLFKSFNFGRTPLTELLLRTEIYTSSDKPLVLNSLDSSEKITRLAKDPHGRTMTWSNRSDHPS